MLSMLQKHEGSVICLLWRKWQHSRKLLNKNSITCGWEKGEESLLPLEQTKRCLWAAEWEKENFLERIVTWHWLPEWSIDLRWALNGSTCIAWKQRRRDEKLQTWEEDLGAEVGNWDDGDLLTMLTSRREHLQNIFCSHTEELC